LFIKAHKNTHPSLNNKTTLLFLEKQLRNLRRCFYRQHCQARLDGFVKGKGFLKRTVATAIKEESDDAQSLKALSRPFDGDNNPA